MPLPELNTSGIDITNTVAKIDAMKTNDLQRQNFQSEIDARTAQAPVVNAMKLMEMKKIQQDIQVNDQKLQSATQEQAGRSFLFLKGIIKPEAKVAAYADMYNANNQEYSVSKGKSGISPLLMPTPGDMDASAIDNFADNGAAALGIVKEQVPGTPYKITVGTPVDPNKPDGAKTYTEHQMRVGKNGKPELLGSSPVESPFAKGAREEKKLTADIANTKVLREETAARDRATVARDKETAAYRKQTLGIALMNANTNKDKAEKTKMEVKTSVTNSAGELVHIMKDGKGYVTTLDSQGIPTLTLATPTQLAGVTKVGRPETDAEKQAAELLSKVTNRGKSNEVRIPIKSEANERILANAAIKQQPLQEAIIKANFKTRTGKDL